jgi:hypothetical protein
VLSHAEGEYQEAEAEKQKSERFTGELEKTSRVHFKGL